MLAARRAFSWRPEIPFRKERPDDPARPVEELHRILCAERTRHRTCKILPLHCITFLVKNSVASSVLRLPDQRDRKYGMSYPGSMIRFAQCGEDGVLCWFFNGRKNGYYVDVGCYDPFRLSNTAMLHLEYGWSGLNIDMDERAISRFNEARPDDINVCIGIAELPGEVEATFFEEGAVNSLDPVMASNPAWAHSFRERRLVKVDRLEHVLSLYLPLGKHIDLLNVDAEGLDHQVLLSNDWRKYRPTAVAVEVHGFNYESPFSSPTYQLMRNLGYKLISQVVPTLIFTDTQHQ